MQAGFVILPYILAKSIIKYNHRNARDPVTQKAKLSDYTTSFGVALVLTIAWLLLYDNKGGKIDTLNYAKGVSMLLIILIGTFAGVYQAHRLQKSKVAQ